MLTERTTSPTIDQTELIPSATDSSALFVVAKNVNSFAIKQIHTLAPKHPGYGYPEQIYDANRVGIPAPLIDFYAPCFHGLTKPFSGNPFPFTSLQNGGRARPTGLKPKWKNVKQLHNTENEKSTGRY
jgi:hypothetical protein